MKNLFLAGGGDEGKEYTFNTFFARSFDRSERILYIPIALKHDPWFTMSVSYDLVTSIVSRMGISKVDMWTNMYDRSWNSLNEYAAICIGGGNTFDLWEEFVDSGFDKMLKRFATTGKPIYGTSAGAIIFGKDIRTATIGKAADENHVGFRQNKCMDLVKGMVIHTHHTNSDDARLIAESKKHDWKILALPEESGAIVQGNAITIQGTKPAVLIHKNEKRMILPGQKV